MTQPTFCMTHTHTHPGFRITHTHPEFLEQTFRITDITDTSGISGLV